eukprot:SAG31_NODE_32432_length_356_cov_0.599222_1_plen_37_part_10
MVRQLKELKEDPEKERAFAREVEAEPDTEYASECKEA